MTTITNQLKKDFYGYLTITILGIVAIAAHLLPFCIFFLFIFLLSDLIANDLHKKVPALSSQFLFVTLYIIIATLVVIISIKFIPLFSRDFSGLYNSLQKDSEKFLNILSQRYDIDLDISFLKAKMFEEGSKSIGKFFHIINSVSKGIIFFIFALALNFLLFFERPHLKTIFTADSDTALGYLSSFLAKRIVRFYLYFRKVMGGQVLISLINTVITLVVVLALNLPHKISLICVVFLCGLLPVVGNIISNTILSLTALFSVGIVGFLVCVGLLVFIHKLEYFLNSKIIGTIIKLPMFVTLISLLIGEATLGIPGMVLAIPFVLTIKDELEGTI